MQTATTLLGILLTGLLAIFGYAHQKRRDRQVTMFEHKRTVYSEFFLVFSQLTQGHGADQKTAQGRALHVRSELALYGSDAVVRAADKFAEAVVDLAQGRRADLTEPSSELVQAMREDLFKGTGIRKEDLTHLMTT